MNSPHSLDPSIGRSIGDRQRYRLENRLGTGGMGDVFLAMDTLLGQQVALKLLKDTLVAAEEPRKRFEREVALCAALKSDHIVAVNDCGVTAEGHPFYVMEHLRGETLGQLLRREQRQSAERTVAIITQVCEGLHLAHEGVTLWRDGAKVSEHVKVIHRDLKPDNIFLVPTALGELVKILDFGIAKIRNDCSESTNLTGMFIGTFHYAAPEQFEFAKDLDERADIYSLGIILYEMLTGTDPFDLGFNLQQVSAMSWMVAHISKPPVPLRSQPGCEQIAPELEAVVMRCLQKAPNDRFASVDELKRHLQAAFAVHSVPRVTTNTEKIIDSAEVQVHQEDEQKLQQDKQEITTNIHHLYPFNPRIYNPSEKITNSVPTAETYNLKPDTQTGEPQKRENKKKLQRLLLKVTGFAAAIVSGSLAYYIHSQRQPDVSTNAILNRDKITLNSSLRQQEAAQLSTLSSENLLKQAEERYKQSYNSKDLENAIDITKAIPKTSSIAKKVEEAIRKWRSEWNKNENYLQAAQKAFKEGKWSEAIAQANQVRLLGQEVKRDTSYWQNKMKPIIEGSEKRIAASNTQKNPTNNAVKPKPRLIRTVRSTAPRQAVRYRAPVRTVRSTAPRRIVRSTAPRQAVRYRAPVRTVRSTAPRRTVRSTAARRTVRSTGSRQTGWTKKRL